MVSDRSGPPDIVHCQHYEGQIEIAASVIGYLNGAVHSLAIDLNLVRPISDQWRFCSQDQLLSSMFGWVAIVSHKNSEFEVARRIDRSREYAFIGQRQRAWQGSGRQPPVIRLDPARSLQSCLIRLPQRSFGDDARN